MGEKRRKKQLKKFLKGVKKLHSLYYDELELGSSPKLKKKIKKQFKTVDKAKRKWFRTMDTKKL